MWPLCLDDVKILALSQIQRKPPGGIYSNVKTLDKQALRCYHTNKFNTPNRWSGDKGDDACPESPRCWESGQKQVVKWTAEGAVKCAFMHRVFCDARACVICRGYIGILLSVRHGRKFKVAPRIVFSSAVTEKYSVRGVFFFRRNCDAGDKTMAMLKLYKWD